MIGVQWQRQGNEKSELLCEKLGFAYQETVEIDGIVYEGKEKQN